MLTLFTVQFSFGSIFVRIHGVLLDEVVGAHLRVWLTCCPWRLKYVDVKKRTFILENPSTAEVVLERESELCVVLLAGVHGS